MKALTKRIDDLERREGVGGFMPYTWVPRLAGQSEEDAIAAHEAAHGPIAGPVLMWREVQGGASQRAGEP
jgi:hypothetical protein